MNIPCPHIGIQELAKEWGVSSRTIKGWLSDAGIKTVVRGRYRVSDIIRYAELYGKPKFSKIEQIEIVRLKKDNQILSDKLSEYHKILLDIFLVTTEGIKLNNEIEKMKKETFTRYPTKVIKSNV